jgi:hypothetical protein
MWGTGNTYTLLMGMKINPTTIKIFKKLKLPGDSAIPLLGIYPKDFK